MSRGTYVVEADWGLTGLFDHARSDISADVRSIVLERGRDYGSQLVGRGVAGSATVELLNTTGKYSRSNASSPLSGLLLPEVPIRVRVTSPVAVSLWYGYLERIEGPRDLEPGQLRTVRLVASGGIARIRAVDDVTIAPSVDITTGDALDAALDAAGWPAGLRSLDTGQTTMRRWWVEDLNALDALRDVEETERGLLLEAVDGDLVFEDRHHRLQGDALDIVAEFSDASGAALRFDRLIPRDADAELFNDVAINVRSYAVQPLAALWTYEGEDALTILAGETLTVWASYPPANVPEGRYVEAWTTPAVGTDITQTGVDNSDLAVTVEKYSKSLRIDIQNNHASALAILTLAQARGTAVIEGATTVVKAADSASQDDFGVRTLTLPGPWHPSVSLAQAMADFIVSRYKDPLDPLPLGIGFNANRSDDQLEAGLTLDLSDRITVVAANTAMEGADMGIDGEYFIESIRHEITEAGTKHRVTYELSPASGDSGYWALGEAGLSELGETTRLAPP